MSIRVMSQVWENTSLDPYERLVMLSLADHADDEGRCYPSIARLCERTGMKERGVQVVIRRLKEKGYVSVAENEGRKGTNLYTVTPAPDAPPHDMHPASDAPHPRTGCTPTPAPDAPEPSLNHQEPSKERVPSFAEFWSAWPLGKIARAKAEAAFKRLSADDKRAATNRARSWATAWRAKNPQAADIHPTTYLNGKRWQDEIGGAAPSSVPVDIRQALADRIKSAKPWNVRDISSAQVRDLLAAGLVTIEDCRKAGVA